MVVCMFLGNFVCVFVYDFLIRRALKFCCFFFGMFFFKKTLSVELLGKNKPGVDVFLDYHCVRAFFFSLSF